MNITAGKISAGVGAIMALGGLFAALGYGLPWTTRAEGQTIIDRLNKADVTQQSIQIEIIAGELDRAWDAYRANPKDQNARALIWRLTRQLKQLDPTIPLPAVP